MPKMRVFLNREGGHSGISLSRVLGFNPSTVKPVLSGPVLNGHPLLSGQL